MKSVLDIIVFKRQSYYTERLLKDIQAFSDSYRFIVFDAFEVKGYFKFFRLPGKPYYWFYPLVFIIDNILIFSLFLYLCLKYKVKTIHIETYSACFVGILRKIGLCEKMIYVTTDYFVKDKQKGFWNIIGFYVFKVLDRFALRWSDVTLNFTQSQFFARKIYDLRKEMICKPHLELKSIPELGRYLPCFIGEARPDSGLDLVPNVNIIRYKDRNELSEKLKDYLCGVNLITQENSCARNTIPSKIMEYFQHGLPVIVTPWVGDIIKDIEDYRLGFVVMPEKKKVEEALKQCYLNQRELTENVINYINNVEFTNMYEIWKA